MVIKYEVRDLLSVPQGYYLAHNISADLSLKGKVAKQIDETFNLKPFLEKELFEDCVGYCILTGNVFNLITKENRHYPVDLEDFRGAVKTMASLCDEFGIRKIAMPKLGTGGDRLDWDDVLPIIKEAFRDLNVEILICVLSEDEIPEPDFDEDELAYAKSIDALIIEEDDILEENSNGDIKVDNSVFDCFDAGTYIDIYICDREGFITSGYTMLDEDDEGIWFEYVGESRD